MKTHRADYSKDPDFEGYLYLYDNEIIEEELHFEELLMKRVLFHSFFIIGSSIQETSLFRRSATNN